MFDGSSYDRTLIDSVEAINLPSPLTKLVVNLPILHNGDEAVFTWSIREGENAQFSRHPSMEVRAKFACALAMRAHMNLEEFAAVADADIELLS